MDLHLGLEIALSDLRSEKVFRPGVKLPQMVSEVGGLELIKSIFLLGIVESFSAGTYIQLQMLECGWL